MQTLDRARAAEAVRAAPGLLKDFLQGKWLGHPLHPLLVHLPTALWPAALVFDILSIAGIARRTMFVSAT